jgi:hypothetical protein
MGSTDKPKVPIKAARKISMRSKTPNKDTGYLRDQICTQIRQPNRYV